MLKVCFRFQTHLVEDEIDPGHTNHLGFKIFTKRCACVPRELHCSVDPMTFAAVNAVAAEVRLLESRERKKVGTSQHRNRSIDPSSDPRARALSSGNHHSERQGSAWFQGGQIGCSPSTLRGGDLTIPSPSLGQERVCIKTAATTGINSIKPLVEMPLCSVTGVIILSPLLPRLKSGTESLHPLPHPLLWG